MMKMVLAMVVMTAGCVTGDNSLPVPDDAQSIGTFACDDSTGGRIDDSGAWHLGTVPNGNLLVAIPIGARHIGFAIDGRADDRLTVRVNMFSVPGAEPFPVVLSRNAAPGFVLIELPAHHGDRVFVLPDTKSEILLSDVFVW